MINVSSEFRKQLEENNKDYIVKVAAALVDGTALEFTNETLMSFSIDDAVSPDSTFGALGCAAINQATISINNFSEAYSQYDFTNAVLTLSVALDLDDGTTQYRETVQKGIFTVDEATYNGGIITLTALDYMAKFDKPYSQSTLSYPATLDAIVRDACRICLGAETRLATMDFPHKTFVVQERPTEEATTFREVISYCAQIAGCFARINTEGNLELKWFETEYLNIEGLDGGTFDEGTGAGSKYVSGDVANGGSFTPWNVGYVEDSGLFSSLLKVHNIHSLYSMNVGVDDVVITGVQASVRVKQESSEDIINVYTSGLPGYVIDLGDKNPFITTSNAQTIVNWLGELLVGVIFRKANINHSNTPIMEAGDIAVVTDRKNRKYPILVTRTNFAIGKPQITISAAETPARNSATRYTQDTKNFVEMREVVVQERTAREVAEQDLLDKINAVNSMYITEEMTSGDLTAIIIHNKPVVSESDIVWKITTNAFGVSTDGGQTYNLGATADGDLIARVLSVIGINADWINTGTLNVGGTNQATDGVIEVKNSSGTRVGRWDKTGFYQGNIASNLNSPNTKIDNDGALATKSLTASDYIYMDAGKNTSKIKIPTWNGTQYGETYMQLDRTGLFAGADSDTRIKIDYVGQIFGYHSDGNYRLMGTGLNFFPSNYSFSTRGAALTGSSLSIDVAFDDPYNLFSVRGSNKTVTIGNNYPSRNVSVAIYGSLAVNGSNYKARVFPTQDYGERFLYCIESPTPLFTDVGDGVIANDGLCYVQIDNVFAETVSLNQYQVFLQKYGNGDCWVKERKSSYFVVEGTPNLSFGWEIKAKQLDFDQYRLEKDVGDITRIQRDIDEKEINYADKLLDHINQLAKQREVTPND